MFMGKMLVTLNINVCVMFFKFWLLLRSVFVAKKYARAYLCLITTVEWLRKDKKNVLDCVSNLLVF